MVDTENGPDEPTSEDAPPPPPPDEANVDGATSADSAGTSDTEADPWADDAPAPQTDEEKAAQQKKYVLAAQIGLVVLSLIVVAAVLIAKGGDDKDSSSSSNKDGNSSATTTTPAKAKKPSWPIAFNGRPPGLGINGTPASKVKSTAKPGIYVWSDFDGMHIWVVKGEGVPPVSGTIDSNAKIDKAVPAIEGAGTVDVADKRATFDLPGTAPIEGVDFNPGFYGNKVVITLNGPDGPVDTKIVKVGKKAAPAPYPLVLEKTVQ